MLVGVDVGPQQALTSLQLGNLAQIGLVNNDCQRDEYWAQLIRDRRVDAVVLGTSTSEKGIKTERACLHAACDLHLPTIVVEDMPGNYQHLRQIIPDLLVVESSSVADHIQQYTDGICTAAIISGGSVRFDSLRMQVKQGRRLEINNLSRRIVWIGQPETQANLISLGLMLPYISRMGLELLFKAHPRDDGYSNGQYQKLFSLYRDNVLDVSGCDIVELLTYQPNFTLTHFSSMAIELAFFGVPCCNVLFPEGGGKIYTKMTNLKRPFLCEAGGSGTIMDVYSIERELQRLLFDDVARKAQMACFDEYFDIETLQQPTVVSAIEGVVVGKQKTGR